MEDVHTGEEKKFFISRWLSREEEDGSLCREIAAQSTLPGRFNVGGTNPAKYYVISKHI
jgi:hypothetical protein